MSSWTSFYPAPLAWRPQAPSPGARRPRRSVLSVPASNPRFVARAAQTAADGVLFDLEDSIAPGKKAETRGAVVRALNETDFGGKLRAVRINDLTTRWAVRDVVDVVEGAGASLDVIMLPKVNRPQDVYALDVMLTSLEQQAGLPAGRIAIEAQIETALGLANVEQIAHASPRLEALDFGPGDYAAYAGIPLLSIGALDSGKSAEGAHAGIQPGQLWHYPILRIVTAAKSAGLQAINGPYGRFRDLEGLKRAAALDYLLGMDGKWVVHPSQIEIVNAAFTPSPEAVYQAQAIVDRYHHAVEAEGLGAVALGEDMLDEASRKLAESLLSRPR